MLNITKKSMRNYTYNADYFGEWFRSSGVTQAQLMKDLGVNNTSLKRWMKDKSNPLPVEKMILFCNTYDIDISEFFSENGQPADIHPRRNREAAQTTRKTVAAPHVPPSGTITKEELLQLKLDHLQEVQRIRQEAQEREEAMRKEYEKRIEEYKAMVHENMEALKMALSKIVPKQEGYAGSYGVSDGKSMGGATLPNMGPFPHVDPKKR